MKLLQVYGHPRSGNHLLMRLLALNFYSDIDLATGPGAVGHWSDRVRNQISPDGRLAGGHGLPVSGYRRGKAIYVYRDGRDVAVSIWRSSHFMNKEWRGVPLSSFLPRKLDWYLIPGRPSEPGMNIVQHWLHHLRAWEGENVCFVRYEDLVLHTDREMDRIAEHFKMEARDEWEKPDRRVGWFPSGGRIGGWRDHFKERDVEYFLSVVPRGFYGLYTGQAAPAAAQAV